MVEAKKKRKKGNKDRKRNEVRKSYSGDINASGEFTRTPEFEIWFDDLSEPLQADILILKGKLEMGLGENSRKTENDGVFRIGETGKPAGRS